MWIFSFNLDDKWTRYNHYLSRLWDVKLNECNWLPQISHFKSGKINIDIIQSNSKLMLSHCSILWHLSRGKKETSGMPKSKWEFQGLSNGSSCSSDFLLMYIWGGIKWWSKLLLIHAGDLGCANVQASVRPTLHCREHLGNDSSTCPVSCILPFLASLFVFLSMFLCLYNTLTDYCKIRRVTQNRRSEQNGFGQVKNE